MNKQVQETTRFISNSFLCTTKKKSNNKTKFQNLHQAEHNIVGCRISVCDKTSPSTELRKPDHDAYLCNLV